MKKELYEELDLEVIRFRTEDIITTSDAITDTNDDMNDDNTTGGKTATRETETDENKTTTGQVPVDMQVS